MSGIYLLRCIDYPQFNYIGCSHNIKIRCYTHKYRSKLKEFQNTKLYKKMNLLGGFDKFEVIILEESTDDMSHDTLRELERKYFEEYKPTLNQQYPYRTNAEYRETYKKEYLEYQLLYRQSHKGERTECECGSLIYPKCLPKHIKSVKHLNYIDNINGNDTE